MMTNRMQSYYITISPKSHLEIVSFIQKKPLPLSHSFSNDAIMFWDMSIAVPSIASRRVSTGAPRRSAKRRISSPAPTARWPMAMTTRPLPRSVARSSLATFLNARLVDAAKGVAGRWEMMMMDLYVRKASNPYKSLKYDCRIQSKRFGTFHDFQDSTLPLNSAEAS